MDLDAESDLTAESDLAAELDVVRQALQVAYELARAAGYERGSWRMQVLHQAEQDHQKTRARWMAWQDNRRQQTAALGREHQPDDVVDVRDPPPIELPDPAAQLEAPGGAAGSS